MLQGSSCWRKARTCSACSFEIAPLSDQCSINLSKSKTACIFNSSIGQFPTSAALTINEDNHVSNLKSDRFKAFDRLELTRSRRRQIVNHHGYFAGGVFPSMVACVPCDFASLRGYTIGRLLIKPMAVTIGSAAYGSAAIRSNTNFFNRRQ